VIQQVLGKQCFKSLRSVVVASCPLCQSYWCETCSLIKRI
jgi:hypothetical protein